MDILYLSSFCSEKLNNALFEKYGASTSYSSRKFNSLIIEGLEAAGNTVDILSYVPGIGGRERYFKGYSETENGRSYSYISSIRVPFFKRIFCAASSAKRIKRWQKEHPGGVIMCDIIVGELSMGLYFCPRRNTRICIATDLPTKRAAKKNIVWRFTSEIKNIFAKKFDGFFVLAEPMCEVINKKNKPHILIEGVADPKTTETENTLENKHSPRVVMMAGLLDEVYGVKALADGFALADIEDTELRLYGFGDSVEYLKALSEKHPCVKYLGQRLNAEIVEEEKKATLLVNPRSAEGEFTKYSFPSKNIEYMASGTPLLCMKLECMPDEYDEHVFFIKESTAEGIAEALKEVFSLSAEELREKGLKGQKFILENKNKYAVGKKLTAFMEEVKNV